MISLSDCILLLLLKKIARQSRIMDHRPQKTMILRERSERGERRGGFSYIDMDDDVLLLRSSLQPLFPPHLKPYLREHE